MWSIQISLFHYIKNWFYYCLVRNIFPFITLLLNWVCLSLPLTWVVFTKFSLCVHRVKAGGMVSPRTATTLARRWRPGRGGRGVWPGSAPGRWSSIKTPRVSVSHYATSSFTLRSRPCTTASRWDCENETSRMERGVGLCKQCSKGVKPKLKSHTKHSIPDFISFMGCLCVVHLDNQQLILIFQDRHWWTLINFVPL